MAMSKELEQTFNACLRCANIEAIRERDMDNGGYGCVISPGSGADSNSPEAQAIRRASEMGKARNAANEQAQKALGAYIR